MPKIYDRTGVVARRPRELDPAKRRFGDEYLVDLDHKEAATRAGFPPEHGARLLANSAVQDYIARAKQRRATRAEISQDYVLRRWHQVVEADPREIAEHWRTPCRYCHGHDHRYQFTAEELRRARQDHLLKQMVKDERHRVEFDDHGGDGYSRRAPIFAVDNGFDHDCPECHGLGVGFVFNHDTRYFGPGARALYVGVKELKDGGVEILTRSKAEAELMLAKHLGVFNDRKPITTFDPERMTDEELNVVIMTYAKRLGVQEEELDTLAAALGPASDPGAGSSGEDVPELAPEGEAEPA